VLGVGRVQPGQRPQGRLVGQAADEPLERRRVDAELLELGDEPVHIGGEAAALADGRVGQRPAEAGRAGDDLGQDELLLEILEGPPDRRPAVPPEDVPRQPGGGQHPGQVGPLGGREGRRQVVGQFGRRVFAEGHERELGRVRAAL